MKCVWHGGSRISYVALSHCQTLLDDQSQVSEKVEMIMASSARQNKRVKRNG